MTMTDRLLELGRDLTEGAFITDTKAAARRAQQLDAEAEEIDAADRATIELYRSWQIALREFGVTRTRAISSSSWRDRCNAGCVSSMS